MVSDHSLKVIFVSGSDDIYLEYDHSDLESRSVTHVSKIITPYVIKITVTSSECEIIT